MAKHLSPVGVMVTQVLLPRLLQQRDLAAFDRLRDSDPKQELVFEVNRQDSHVLEARFCMTFGKLADTSSTLGGRLPFPAARVIVTEVLPQPGYVRIKRWLKTPSNREPAYPAGRMGIDDNGAMTAELTTATHHIRIALDEVDVELKPATKGSGKILTLKGGGRRKLASRLCGQPGFQRLLDAKLIRRTAKSLWPTGSSPRK